MDLQNQQSEDSLTIETIAKKFNSQFDMVNHAIHVVANMIESGRASRVKTASKNPAAQVIAEMFVGKDFLEEIKPAEINQVNDQPPEHKVKGYSSFKTNTQRE